MKPPLPPTRGSSSQAKGNGIINSYGFGDCAITTRASCSSAFNYSFTEKATFTIAALIKLKQDGCFEIKNLGKFSIRMKEEEIGHREVVILKNSCLIQI
ncbi:hypothetical protein ARALYDRAFT_895427 [Arabidopsis lyrata subsp. lyrata]|uniref:Uncharacterized protein n=1 Tax=Arabidopsis lyrata subsp. lyrata TaxID=81972 RepID=D7KSQ6_ARALL|nr:hypothetical protein ARALYDRAFT_895427 [Arabidopsis lyrata subsp. lyrata]